MCHLLPGFGWNTPPRRHHRTCLLPARNTSSSSATHGECRGIRTPDDRVATCRLRPLGDALMSDTDPRISHSPEQVRRGLRLTAFSHEPIHAASLARGILAHSVVCPTVGLYPSTGSGHDSWPVFWRKDGADIARGTACEAAQGLISPQ